MTALQSPVATIIHNIYTEKRENYLNSKNYDVTIFVKDQGTGDLLVKIQIPYNQLASFLTILSTQNVQTSTSILSEDKKRLFPKTPEKIADIIKNKPKLISLIFDWYSIVPYFIEVFTLHSLHFRYRWFYLHLTLNWFLAFLAEASFQQDIVIL